MARKDKNSNPMDSVQQSHDNRSSRGGRGKKNRKETNYTSGATSECGHSAGILPYLLQPLPKLSHHKGPKSSRIEELRRTYKQEFGYKPVGMTEDELASVLQLRGVKVADLKG